MDEAYLIRELRRGLIAWYEFRPGAKVLFLGEEDGEHNGLYDYVVCLKIPEQIDESEKIFRECSSLLKEDGICILAVNNRLGIRYFCGDRLSGSAYSKAEIMKIPWNMKNT